MSFAPETPNAPEGGQPNQKPRVYPVPRAGTRPARISLIVDLGTQEREPFESNFENTSEQNKTIEERGATVVEKGGKKILCVPQKPIRQVVVFADLTADVVDYGEGLGMKPYRLMLNKSFMGDITGTTFAGMYPITQDGLDLKGAFTFHSNSILSKLSKIMGVSDRMLSGKGPDNMNVDLLLNGPFMASIEIKTNESKTAKDDEGKPIVFTNIHFRGASLAPMIPGPDGDEIPYPIPDVDSETQPMSITFDSVTEDNAKFIRADVKRKIMKAQNYGGSKMQEVFVATGFDTVSGDTARSAPVQTPEAPVQAPIQQPQAPEGMDDFDDDVPF
jgi:hypothetical protein